MLIQEYVQSVIRSTRSEPRDIQQNPRCLGLSHTSDPDRPPMVCPTTEKGTGVETNKARPGTMGPTHRGPSPSVKGAQYLQRTSSDPHYSGPDAKLGFNTESSQETKLTDTKGRLSEPWTPNRKKLGRLGINFLIWHPGTVRTELRTISPNRALRQASSHPLDTHQ